MFFWNKICGLAIFFISVSFQVSGQQLYTPEIRNESSPFINAVDIDTLPPIPSTQFLLRLSNYPTVIPGNLSTRTLGFFCRQEMKLEKAFKIPFRFRLGSLKQCNYYEGK